MGLPETDPAHDCGPDRAPQQNARIRHEPARIDNAVRFAKAPAPKGDRDMDDRPFNRRSR